MSKPTAVRWGIMATGGIARTFTKDLLIDPTTRGTTDILHQVTAVASSSSADSADRFVAELVRPKQDLPCHSYPSYQALVQDPAVDIIYVATPHSHHYQHVRLCLEAGKPVLCEKAFTVNAAQARILYQIAREKNLFLMEAVWTRYFPLSIAVRNHIIAGDLGEVIRVSADLSVGSPPQDSFDPSHRMINKDLAGGCLLDLGIYSLTWLFQCLYHTLPLQQRQPPKVQGVAMTFEPRTGSDEMTSVLLEFPKSAPSGHTRAHAIASASLSLDHSPDNPSLTSPAVRIQGTKAEIQVFGLTSRPARYKLVPWQSNSSSSTGSSTADAQGGRPHDFESDFPGEGTGMYWEADEAARCWRDQRLESKGLSWEESTVIMETMDEIRRQGGLTYPDLIESTDYPLTLDVKRE